MQRFKSYGIKAGMFGMSLLLLFTGTSSISVMAAEPIPSPIAWQQNEKSGAEQQRLTYLPEEENWCDYPWNRGTETGNTVGQAGCSLLSVVNAIYYRTGIFINPRELAQYALDNGYRIAGVDGTTLSFFPAVAQTYHSDQIPISFDQWTTSASIALQHVREGGTASANIVGHWIALVDYDAETDQYLILDSAYTCNRAANITWTDLENGVAWLSADTLSANGKSGYYGINGRYTALYTFESISSCQTGDVDHDTIISVEDAVQVLTYYAKQAAGNESVFGKGNSENQSRLQAADVNQDGIIDVSDATMILTYYAKKAASIDVTWEQLQNESEVE